MKKSINVAFTFDLDPDQFDFFISKNYRSQIYWHEIEKNCISALGVLEENFEQNLKCTWFLRVDEQIKYFMGSYTSFLEQNENLINFFINKKQLIGFHPHLEKLDHNNNKWVLNKNINHTIEEFSKSFYEFKQFGLSPKITRIGGNLSIPELFQTMDKLGVIVDSTAIPGRYRNDSERHFNWKQTKGNIYQPSSKNPQISDKHKLNLIEIPFTMFKIKADYDLIPFSRYVDFTFEAKKVKEAFKTIQIKNNILLIILHPSLLSYSNLREKHGLIKYGLMNFKKNILFLKRYLKSNYHEINFVSLKDLSKKYNEGQL